MDVVVKIMGMIFVLAAILYLWRPGILKHVIEFFRKGKRLYLAGLIRLVLAVVFLLAARECDQPIVIGAFGVLLIISGLLIFILGPKKVKAVLDWYQKQSLLFFRILAIIALLLGIIIIYSA